MMQYYAQLHNGVVQNVIEGDPTGRFDPSIVWVPCTSSTRIGDIYNATKDSFDLPVLSLEQEKNISFEVIKQHYNTLMRVITSEYDVLEMITWSIQIEEARAILNGRVDDAPFLSGVAAERHIDIKTLAERVLYTNNAFRTITGRLTGKRQYFEDLIKGADSLEALQEVRRKIQQWQEKGLSEL